MCAIILELSVFRVWCCSCIVTLGCVVHSDIVLRIDTECGAFIVL